MSGGQKQEVHRLGAGCRSLPADACLDVAHHAEIDVCQPIVGQAQQVPWMWVRVVKASLQNLRCTLILNHPVTFHHHFQVHCILRPH